MLKYSVKLTNDSIQQKELDWGEKYLDPNLSFVTGVTSASNHLEKHDRITVSNNIINSSSIVSVDTENVLRQGYVIVRGKQYDVKSATITDYSLEETGKTIDYQYVMLNGKYYYSKEVVRDGVARSVFFIDHWLTEDSLVSGKTVEMGSDGKLDTIYWIEDGKVVIDGNVYDYDFNRSGLTYSIDNKMLNSGETLSACQITCCDGILYRPYPSASQYQEVTKFKLIKDENYITPFDRITYCKYFFYVMYKNHYCPIVQVFNGNAYSFKCEIPRYVLSATTRTDDSMATESFSVYFTNETIDEPVEITNENVVIHGVRELADLRNVTSLIKVDDAIFYVRSDIQNANDGKQIGIYLRDGEESISVGDTLRFKKTDDTFYTVTVQNQENDGQFVVFANKKWYVEPNLCDKAIINGNEYDINYINGKNDNVDCLVMIDDEEIPFKISGNTLIKYGKIVSSSTDSAVSTTYNIESYSGVTINGKKYIVRVNDYYNYAELYDTEREYVFTVDDIIGSSLLVCSPRLTTMEYTQDLIDALSYEMCNDLISNQGSFILYGKNKVFGDKEITKELAFLTTDAPTSSDDYYDLFSSFVIYSRDGYINIPLKLDNVIGENPIKDNIVERDFFEKEKKKAINPIVDMEKDIYYPKFINNSNNNHEYKGSTTEFKPIRQINLNLHFRTRNVSPRTGNWKVYESYDNIGKEDFSNWFITDWEFYRGVVENKNDRLDREDTAETLQETSDLLGLLFFTNYDVYYQKQKLAKSFVRLSYYDSTDPQTQNLLATSTVFINEHALFKTFIDNSKIELSAYTIVDESTNTPSNKITVFTECGNKIDENRRLSSRLTIKSKYETDTSSEGFYIYMFREYSENLRPKPIYMKVEFNHAGVGKTVPFSIPMKWEDKISGETHPTEALTLRNNRDELKQGYPLSYVYAQSYIPLYAVYDFKNKEYAYVFDDRYFIDSSKAKIYSDGVVNLNLFEMKIKNETTTSEEEMKLIARKQQVKAAINVNTSQFPPIGETCN